LVVIDPPFGDNHHGDNVSQWDSPDKAWTTFELDSCLNILKKSKKTSNVYTVVVYTTLKLASSFWDVLTKAGLEDVHLVDVYRYGVTAEITSKSYVIVGTVRKNGTSGTGAPRKSPPESSLHFYLPYGLSRNCRPDINGRDIQDVGGKRQRCVDEFRHFVRAYCEPNTWVMCLHSGTGGVLLAALLECRNAVGLEPCVQLNNAASWRLHVFKQTEDVIRDRMEAAANVLGQDQGAAVAQLIEQDMDEVFQRNPFRPSPEDLAKLGDQISASIKSVCGMMMQVLTPEQMDKMKEDAMRLFGSNHDMLHDVLKTEKGKKELLSFLIQNLPPTQSEPPT